MPSRLGTLSGDDVMACVLSDQHVHDLDVGRQSTVGKQEKEVQARLGEPGVCGRRGATLE